MQAYETIARVIRYLDAHHVSQPDLATLAGVAGLSPYHFHRLFAGWAGVTPKDFLQCLTLAHARASLRLGASVLEAALDAGLSGPARLHDLCVSLEAATPGEVKSGGAGWTLRVGVADSPFGRCVLAESPRGICQIGFVDDVRAALAALRTAWPAARLRRDDAHAADLAARVFALPGARAAGPPLRAYVRGSAFRVQVWRALLRVPPGALVSYGMLAAAAGCPRAARATGSAVGANPLAYLIPCHRVIRETGAFGNYEGGPIRKQAIIAWEASRTQPPRGAPGGD